MYGISSQTIAVVEATTLSEFQILNDVDLTCNCSFLLICCTMALHVQLRGHASPLYPGHINYCLNVLSPFINVYLTSVFVIMTMNQFDSIQFTSTDVFY